MLAACHHLTNKCYLSDKEFWSMQKVDGTISCYGWQNISMALSMLRFTRLIPFDVKYIYLYGNVICLFMHIYYLLGKKTILDHILSWGINLKFKVLTIFYHSIIWQTKIKWKHKTNAHSRHLACFGVCASSLPKYFLPLSGFEPWC